MDKSSEITISVVIPAYNCEKHIKRALDSVLAQTRRPDEIIVVDDGSTDRTAEIADSFGSKIKLIKQENAGASVARNTGIQAATGQWIAFLDADDEWLPEKLQIQLEHLKRNPQLQWTSSNSFRCNCNNNHKKMIELPEERTEDTKLRSDQKEYFDDYFQAYLNHATGNTDTMLIKKNLLVEAGLFRKGQLRINDVDMWIRIAFSGKPIGFVRQPLAVYHLDIPNSIVKTYKKFEFIDDFIDRNLKLAEESGMLEKFKPCAKSMLGWWIQERIKEKNGKQARIILRKYKHLFGLYCWTTTYIRSLFPRISSFYESIKKTSRPNK